MPVTFEAKHTGADTKWYYLHGGQTSAMNAAKPGNVFEAAATAPGLTRKAVCSQVPAHLAVPQTMSNLM